MGLSSLSATLEYPSGYRPPDRRAVLDFVAPVEPAPPPPEPAPEFSPLDVALFASRFKADLTRLRPPSEPVSDSDASEAESDAHLFDFFGNLSVLLLAVRAGDLTRAQSAADALEMDVLVERNSGRRPAESSLLDDLGRLFGAAHSRDEAGARAAAGRLAGEFRHVLAPPVALATEAREPGAAAYETLAHYFDAEAAAI